MDVKIKTLENNNFIWYFRPRLKYIVFKYAFTKTKNSDINSFLIEATEHCKGQVQNLMVESLLQILNN